MHHQLLGHLLGALDDDEQGNVDARLAYDEEYRQALVEWRRRLTPLVAMRPEFDPPSDLAERTCLRVAALAFEENKSRSGRNKPQMSAAPVPPSGTSGVSWLDAAVMTLLLITAVTLIIPAIQSSRFQARLASCQTSLRQFGLALAQYGQNHGNTMDQLADNGHLTQAGAFACDLLHDGGHLDGLWTAYSGVCPAIQEVLQKTSRNLQNSQETSPTLITTASDSVVKPWPSTDLCMANEPRPTNGRPGNKGQKLIHGFMIQANINSWSDIWRDGTDTRRLALEQPVDSPLLADAPSADLSDQDSAGSYNGRGCNVLFQDGHAAFSAYPVATEQALTHGELAVSNPSLPILLVGCRSY